MHTSNTKYVDTARVNMHDVSIKQGNLHMSIYADCVSLSTSFPILGKTRKGQTELVELECRLQVAYWAGAEDGLYDWEIESVCIDGPTPMYITEDTDPDLWSVLSRSLNMNNKTLDAEVQERIENDIEWSR